MSKPTKIVMDCSTGIQSTVELTDEEIADLEIANQIAQARREEEKAAEEAKAAARESALAKLTALGLTEDEAKAIAG